MGFWFFRRSPALVPGIDHAHLVQQLSGIYSDDCCHLHHADLYINAIDDDELDALLDRLIKRVWREKGMPTKLSNELIEYYAELLWEAIQEGYGTGFTSIDTDTPDAVMLEKLRNDVWLFSAAKSWQQAKALSSALVDDEGKVRSWGAFKRAAYDINNQHVGAWLQAEYNLALTSAQAAAKWVQIEQDRDTLPLLRFSAIIDDGTTEICRNFNGIRLPIDHWFWDQYYVPNHFGERSEVVQDPDGEVTDITTVVFPDRIPKIFRTNLAKKGMAFPEGHPYYSQFPLQQKENAGKLAEKHGR